MDFNLLQHSSISYATLSELQRGWLYGILLFAGILLITWLIKGPVVKFIVGSLEKLTRRTKATWDDVVLASIEKPIKYLVVLTGVLLAVAVLPLPSAIQPYLEKIYTSGIVLIIGYILYHLEALYIELFTNFGRRLSPENSEALKSFFSKVLRFIIVALCVVIILDQFSVNVGAFVAGLGISGLAFALAAQDTLSNLIAGVTLLFDRPFEVGDRIKSNGIDGIVTDISFRTTRLKTLNQEYVTIPNKEIANNAIVNLYRIDHLRNAFTITCDYKTTPDQLTQLVDQVSSLLNNHQGVLDDSVSVSFEGFGSSALNVQVIFVSQSGTWADFVSVRQEINLEIMKIMQTLGIEFAFPSQSVYFETPLVVNSKEFSNH